MSLFKGSYLRVLSPKTTDGRTPMLDNEGRIVYAETPLPVTAKRDLELQNKDLPDILKKKIELVTVTSTNEGVTNVATGGKLKK